MDGEKDPRGVVQVCQILQTSLELWSTKITGNTLNDVFMVINGYFPVTYITPPIVAGNKDIVTSVRCYKHFDFVFQLCFKDGNDV